MILYAAEWVKRQSVERLGAGFVVGLVLFARAEGLLHVLQMLTVVLCVAFMFRALADAQAGRQA